MNNLSYLRKSLSYLMNNLSYLRKNLSYLMNNLSYSKENLSYSSNKINNALNYNTNEYFEDYIALQSKKRYQQIYT